MTRAERGALARRATRIGSSRRDSGIRASVPLADAPSMSADLAYVMEGSRTELKRFIDALWQAGITSHVRPKADCAPTS